MGCGTSKSAQVVASTTPTAKHPEKPTITVESAQPGETIVEKKPEEPQKTESPQEPPKTEQHPISEANQENRTENYSEPATDQTTGAELVEQSKSEQLAELPKQPEGSNEESKEAKKEESPSSQVEEKSEAKIQIQSPEEQPVPVLAPHPSDELTQTVRPSSPAPNTIPAQTPSDPKPNQLSPRKITEEPLPVLPLRQLSVELQRPRSVSPRHPRKNVNIKVLRR